MAVADVEDDTPITGLPLCSSAPPLRDRMPTDTGMSPPRRGLSTADTAALPLHWTLSAPAHTITMQRETMGQPPLSPSTSGISSGPTAAAVSSATAIAHASGSRRTGTAADAAVLHPDPTELAQTKSALAHPAWDAWAWPAPCLPPCWSAPGRDTVVPLPQHHVPIPGENLHSAEQVDSDEEFVASSSGDGGESSHGGGGPPPLQLPGAMPQTDCASPPLRPGAPQRDQTPTGPPMLLSTAEPPGRPVRRGRRRSRRHKQAAQAVTTDPAAHCGAAPQTAHHAPGGLPVPPQPGAGGLIPLQGTPAPQPPGALAPPPRAPQPVQGAPGCDPESCLIVGACEAFAGKQAPAAAHPWLVWIAHELARCGGSDKLSRVRSRLCSFGGRLPHAEPFRVVAGGAGVARAERFVREYFEVREDAAGCATVHPPAGLLASPA
eukprot:TRINITY_DN51763_c0_g1_i1.p1 TRINITY_DN51763_c0_g1~~TRINITY_DN51763_c0_g1_i1.p1  ORF type:complete len:435 (+),score=72.18 TRINITY_DN51763_c0_g1_i1:109-1413(+)